ncbi:Homeodomain-like protein [Helicostylum pulchrum]|nr:Homeodomain-like protein [Helicostylum pulchrum]
MYQQDSSAMDTTTLRIFSPIILFHDATACSDNQVIQLKKQKVNAMLKSNGQFWSNVIQSTRNSAFSSPPQTPPPTLFTSCNSSVASSCDEPRQKKRRGNLPKSVTAILKQWLIDHCRHPYPTEEEKRSLRLKTNLTLNQISNWFINARRRILPLILSSPNNSKNCVNY